MLFDLESVATTVHSVVCLEGAHTTHLLFHPFWGSMSRSRCAREQRVLGECGMRFSLLFCNTMSYMSAVVPFTCLQCISIVWAHDMAERVSYSSFHPYRLLLTSLFDRSGG